MANQICSEMISWDAKCKFELHWMLFNVGEALETSYYYDGENLQVEECPEADGTSDLFHYKYLCIN